MKSLLIFLCLILPVKQSWAEELAPFLLEQLTEYDFETELDIYYKAIESNLFNASRTSSTLSNVHALCQNFQEFEIFLLNNQKYKAQYFAYMEKFQHPETMDETIQFVTNLNRDSKAECSEAEQYHHSLSKLPKE